KCYDQRASTNTTKRTRPFSQFKRESLSATENQRSLLMSKFADAVNKVIFQKQGCMPEVPFRTVYPLQRHGVWRDVRSNMARILRASSAAPESVTKILEWKFECDVCGNVQLVKDSEKRLPSDWREIIKLFEKDEKVVREERHICGDCVKLGKEFKVKWPEGLSELGYGQTSTYGRAA